MNFQYLSFIFVISIFTSVFFTYFLIDYMIKLGALDHPGSRRSHEIPTPRGAGISFVIAASIIVPVYEYIIWGHLEFSKYLLPLFLPISLISFYEDVSSVSIFIRFIVYGICSFLAIDWLIHPNIVFPYEISLQLDLIIAGFALLAFINVYNFMDGIDGITASQSIHLSSTIIVLCYLNYDIIPNVDLIIAINLIVFSWSLGFMFFNWHPAKIFLGDVGSISIGFILGVCILTVATASAKLFLACVIASLYYIADGGLVVLIRFAKGEKIWEPHLQHFFQKALKKFRSHSLVVKQIIKCNFCLMILSIFALYYPIISAICAFFVVVITIKILTK